MKGQKFIDFENYLKNSGLDFLEFSFEKIESLIGQKLPTSAYQYEVYWYHPETHTFPNAWKNAGYRMKNLDLRAHKVSFTRIEDNIENNLPTRCTLAIFFTAFHKVYTPFSS